MTGTGAASASGFPRAVGPGDVPAASARRPDAPPTGYRGPTACAAAGITYRQLDYWARTGLVEPSIRSATGSGSQRMYSFRDIIALKIVKRLLDTGVSLQNIRIAVGYLRARGEADLAGVTLMSDGASVYECTSPDEVFDLVQGGQGVFGIAVDAVCREVEGTLRQFPGGGEDVVGGSGGSGAGSAGSVTGTVPGDQDDASQAVDELARRRRIKAV
ncbi:MerR family transcriptional regulator [Catenulispora rubra]|uniref:MerR family transcriptional regulator n=1 Tax=Catenulispora rubra TaxID=280293 RepID=UPI0018921DC1|nr:MerR family transcriptional regulator [Catenulispora rubra]